MTISMDGRYYRRGDSQKRPVRILCVDAPNEFCVVYLDEDGTARTTDANGSFFGGERDAQYDLLPIPQPPCLVPLEAKDVPPGSVVRKYESNEYGWRAVQHVINNEIAVNHNCETVRVSFHQLMTGGWQILRPGSTEWQPCSKPEGAVS